MNSICIKGDYMYALSEFLRPLDIVNICKALNKTKNRHKWRQLFEQRVISNIDGWFRGYFGDRYEEFRKSMIQSKAVVTGSFIIQMILNESWESDIDIFFPTSEQNIPNSVDYRYGLDVSHIENFLYSDHEYDDIDDPNIRPLYSKVFRECYGKIRNYQANNKPGMTEITYFQVISLSVGRSEFQDKSRETNLHRIILKYIDFDICKNMFWYDDNGCNIYIHRPDQIINKKFSGRSVSPSPDPRRNVVPRREKYENRGFTHV